MTIDEMIAVLTAAKAGKVIEYWSNLRNGWYKTAANQPSWNFHTERYRVKPEPREWYVWVEPNGTISQHGNLLRHRVAQEIKVREVLPSL